MSESRHDDLLGRILRRIPGFRGYAQREDQQQSEEQTRQFVLQRLQRAKGTLDRAGRELADRGQIDQLAPLQRALDQLEAIRVQLERPALGASRLLGAVLDPDALEDLYDLEANLMDQATALSELSQQLDNSQEVMARLDELEASLDRLAASAQRRHESLTALLK